MHLTAIFLVTYGVLVLLGGAFGYIKAKSLPSLVAGVVSAVVVIIAAVLFQRHPRLSLCLSAIVSLVLTAVMLARYQSTKKPMPAIPVAVLSFITFAYSVFKLVTILHSHSA